MPMQHLQLLTEEPSSDKLRAFSQEGGGYGQGRRRRPGIALGLSDQNDNARSTSVLNTRAKSPSQDRTLNQKLI